MSLCTICCLPFTTKLRKEIACKYCNHVCCISCVKSYLLSITTDPKCMKCDVGWDHEFIDLILSKSFRTGDLRKHRETILLGREKSLLPETVTLVQVVLQKRAKQAELDELIKRKAELQQQIEKINQSIYEVRNDISTLSYKTAVVTERKTFIRACPANGCRGFLSSQWKCGLCSVKVCKDCHEVLVDGHVCKPENIETAKLLEKDTKPCPKCACMIFKIDGCNQMWCTQCHTAFDWKTGKIENTNVHNPHYYDWLRQREGINDVMVVAANPCRDGVLPESWHINDYLKRKNIRFDYYNIHRGIHHIQDVEMPRHRPKNTNNSDLRVQYLLNEISEDEFKRDVQRRETKNIKLLSYYQIFEMLVNVSSELMNKIFQLSNQKECDVLKDEFESLRTYFNTCMMNLSKRHNSKVVKELDRKWFLIQ